jgi:hypothetical protein
MPILRNQAKAGPLHAGVPGEVYRRSEKALGSGVMRRAPVPGSRSLGRIDFGRQRMLPDQGPLPKHFCCGKWREMTSVILTK